MAKQNIMVVEDSTVVSRDIQNRLTNLGYGVALRTLDGNVDALWSVADSTVFSSGSTEFILLHTLRNRIPFMGLSPAFVKAGALMALAAVYQEVGAQCGEHAVRIFLGDHPSSLPITIPQEVTMYLNLKTAEIIGLKIPPDRVKGAVVIKQKE